MIPLKFPTAFHFVRVRIFYQFYFRLNKTQILNFLLYYLLRWIPAAEWWLTKGKSFYKEKIILIWVRKSFQHWDHPVLTFNLYAGFDKYFLELKPSKEDECSDSELRSRKVNPPDSSIWRLNLKINTKIIQVAVSLF